MFRMIKFVLAYLIKADLVTMPVIFFRILTINAQEDLSYFLYLDIYIGKTIAPSSHTFSLCQASSFKLF